MKIDGWNDVKDDLPINGMEDVLVTVRNNGVTYVIPDARWNHGKWEELAFQEWVERDFLNPYEDKWHDYEYRPITGEVLAWMLMPEPYEEEE